MSFLFILSCYTFDNCPSFPKYQIAEINIFKNKNFLLRSNFVRCLNVSNLKKSNLKVERNFCVRIRRLLHIFERTVIRLTKSNPISNKRPSWNFVCPPSGQSLSRDPRSLFSFRRIIEIRRLFAKDPTGIQKLRVSRT